MRCGQDVPFADQPSAALEGGDVARLPGVPEPRHPGELPQVRPPAADDPPRGFIQTAGIGQLVPTFVTAHQVFLDLHRADRDWKFDRGLKTELTSCGRMWPQEVPQQDSRRHTGEFACSGTIIAPRYVLTAAHCVEDKIKFVRVGDNFGRNPDCEGKVCAPKVQDIKIKNVFKHPQYDTRRLINDIAILELAKDIKYNEFVQPACLLDTSKKVTGRVEVAGWGYVDNAKTIIDNLQYVNLPVAPYDMCMAVYKVPRRLSTRQYCVGNFKGTDSCSGDSGGPMTKELRHKGQRRNYVVGLVSYGLERCGLAPALYTDVAFYRNWIQNIIKG